MANETPPIGSKISVITKSDIRYVGVLCSVGMSDAIIAMTDVRCFGTEDRHVAVPVPPCEQVARSIILNACDVKERVICKIQEDASTAYHKMADKIPYIGRKVSVIARSNIRYQGILCTVGTTDSSIALANARSFGTEDRIVPIRIPSRDIVYEYMVFKCHEIRDFTVCEARTPASPRLAYDPAIISVSDELPQEKPYSNSCSPATRARGCSGDPVFGASRHRLERNRPGNSPCDTSSASRGYREFNHGGVSHTALNPTAVTEAMEKYETCTGVFVRKENDIYIIWTKRFNHVYVRRENFDTLFEPCDRVDCDVSMAERINGQYRYEGFRCRFSEDLSTDGGEFVRCVNSEDKHTIQWRGNLELTDDQTDDYYIIRGIDNGGVTTRFVSRALIRKSTGDQFKSRNIKKFAGIVMLRHFAEPNVCPWEFCDPRYLETINPVAAAGKLEYERCLGVFVREENDNIYIIWTTKYNHIYVRKQNFNPTIKLFHRVDVDVYKEERVLGDYRYEGSRCRFADNIYAPHHINTFFGGEFSECWDLKNRRTIQWRGLFELTNEKMAGGGFIRSIKFDLSGENPPRFIEKAFIPKADREHLLMNRAQQFEASVMLFYFAEPNISPWRLKTIHQLFSQDKPLTSSHKKVCESAYHTGTQKKLELKQRKQLNASLLGTGLLQSGSSIFVPAPKVIENRKMEASVNLLLYGYCLFSDQHFNYFYCCDHDTATDQNTFFGCILKVPNSFEMNIGLWYRLILNTNNVMVNPNPLPVDCIIKIEWTQSRSDEILFLISPKNAATYYSTKVIAKVFVRLIPAFAVLSPWIATLDDPNGILLTEAHNHYGLSETGDTMCFIVQVGVSIMNGFEVTCCFGTDIGVELEAYIELANTPAAAIHGNLQEVAESSENRQRSMKQPIVVVNKATQDVIQVDPILHPIGSAEHVQIPVQVKPSIEICPEEMESSFETAPEPEESDIKHMRLNIGTVKGLVKHLMSDKLKSVIESEGLVSALDEVLHSMKNGRTNRPTMSEQPSTLGNRIDNSHNIDDSSSILQNQRPDCRACERQQSTVVPIEKRILFNPRALKNVIRALRLPRIKHIINEEGLSQEADALPE